MAKRYSTMPVRPEAYYARSKNLYRIGYPDYQLYLKSELWRDIRKRVLARGECWACGGRPNRVHHSSYSEETLLGRDDSKLYAICDQCHHWSHRDGYGFHVEPAAATSRLATIRRKRLNLEKKALKAAHRQAGSWTAGPKRKRHHRGSGGNRLPCSFTAQSLIENSRLGGSIREAWLDAMALDP